MLKKNITIVGPGPGQDENKKGNYSNNVECILLMAKYCFSFRKKLLMQTETALNECNIPMKESEKLLITSAPRNQLSRIIKHFHIDGITKNSLADWKIASLVLALISSISMGQNTTPNDSVSIQGALSESVRIPDSLKAKEHIVGRIMTYEGRYYGLVEINLNGKLYYTDEQGIFVIPAHKGDTIKVTAKGFKKQELIIDPKKINIKNFFINLEKE